MVAPEGWSRDTALTRVVVPRRNRHRRSPFRSGAWPTAQSERGGRRSPLPCHFHTPYRRWAVEMSRRVIGRARRTIDRPEGERLLPCVIRNDGSLLSSKLVGAVVSLICLAMSARERHSSGCGPFFLVLGFAEGHGVDRRISELADHSVLQNRTGGVGDEDAQVFEFLRACGIVHLTAAVARCAIMISGISSEGHDRGTAAALGAVRPPSSGTTHRPQKPRHRQCRLPVLLHSTRALRWRRR